MFLPACRQEEGWKSLRSRVNKQILPQKVAAFAPLLNEVALEFVKHLRENQDKDGYVSDIYQPLVKWAFEGESVHVRYSVSLAYQEWLYPLHCWVSLCVVPLERC